MIKEVTRIAPSPTGDMHIGTARTAYFNWLIARATGGKFILRIDDTDLARNDEKCVDVIHQVMQFLGLNHDETFRQSQRLQRYRDVAEKLVGKGLAVRATNGAILFQPNYYPGHFHDTVAGDIAITDNDKKIINGMVLFKGEDKGAGPTYHWASVVDDADFCVTRVVRGVDHLTNTAKHLVLYHAIEQALGVGLIIPKFSHLGLIMGRDPETGKIKKLSKRDGASSMLKYIEDGWHPDGLLNGMLRLGWGPKVDNKANTIMSRRRATNMFIHEGNMKANPATLDMAKLKWYDEQYKKGATGE